MDLGGVATSFVITPVVCQVATKPSIAISGTGFSVFAQSRSHFNRVSRNLIPLAGKFHLIAYNPRFPDPPLVRFSLMPAPFQLRTAVLLVCLPAVLTTALLPSVAIPVSADEGLSQNNTTTVSRQAKPSAANPRDWSRFRGPDGLGVAAHADTPLEWNNETGLVWATPLPGAGASSPVTWNDRIYLTCYTGYFVPGVEGGTPADLRRHLLAFDRATGKLLWNQAVAARLPEEEKIRDHGFAASTPAVDADFVYVFFGKTGVLAFDHSGREVWRADVGERTHGWGSAASPVLYGDLLIVNASVESDALIALDRKTGAERWRVEGIKESWNTPLVARSREGRQELILAIQGKLLGLDPVTGKSLWSCQTDITWYMVPSCVVEDGVAYCLGGRSGVAGLAVRLGGTGDVTATHRLWTSQKGTNVSSPIVHEGHLYWVNDQREIAYCTKAETGEVVYEQRLERAGQFYGSPVLANGRLYYLSRFGRTFVVAAKPEFELLATNDFADRTLFNGSPVPDGKRLLIRSDTFLYCVGE